MKTIVFREGNPFMEMISENFDGKKVVLKFGEDESWVNVIKNNLSADVDEVSTDYTAGRAVDTAIMELGLSIKVKSLYAGDYVQRLNYYKLVVAEAKKNNVDGTRAIIILDNIYDHVNGINEEAKTRLSPEDLSLERNLTYKRQTIIEKEIRNEIEEEIRSYASKNGVMPLYVDGVNWEDDGLVMIDHHAVRHLPQKTNKIIMLACPCCIINPSCLAYAKEKRPNIKFIGGD